MKKTTPLLLTGITLFGLIAGCSPEPNENATSGGETVSQSPSVPESETATEAPQDPDAIRASALETVTGYMESITKYSTADLEAATTPEETRDLLEPTLKYFYTGDLSETDVLRVEAIVKMSVTLWSSTVESSDQSEEINAEHARQIEALRADPSTLDLIMSTDGKTLVAVSPTMGGLPMIEVDGKWLIDGKGALADTNSN